MTTSGVSDGTPQAQALISDLLDKYGITDPRTAHREIRERFSQADLDTYRAALTVLYGNGELG
ncbi:hypothetical protein [Cellulomonas sp. ES6]|uniref:hypothetical protein n=1 Tax=Cellulomonas sp. ES6 TaxID=3039384 RepID=UPI0024B7FD1B|nr:hypothetical protein [Cellulomonas sp. ES6]WHP18813.1 hypothetical protein P9841_06770 [Cellulomonas sp. ES6]